MAKMYKFIIRFLKHSIGNQSYKRRGGGSGEARGPWPPRYFAGIEKRTEEERDNLLLVAPWIFGPSAASELSKMR